MASKNYIKTSVLLFIAIAITFLPGATAAGEQQPDVEDLLYKGRLELVDENPTRAIEYFTKALNKCEPGSPNYNGRYGRCNFFVGEGYFQRFEMQRNVSDAKRASKYFEAVIDFGKKTAQDYPSKAKMRIRQVNRALSVIETGVSPKTERTFKVKTIPKGTIVFSSWKIYIGSERINNPFSEVFFVHDKINGMPELVRKAVYISEAGAAEVARRIGIQRLSQGKYSYDRYDVLNTSRTFRKPGYADIVLKNGERFNGQWAVIEYDGYMPALPVKLFEHFGATVQVDWSERKVEINAKTDTPATKDWFILTEALKLPPSGARGDWIIGFNELQMPEKIYPGQLVQGRADIRIKDSAKNSAGAVIYISLFGDWSPGIELARIYKGKVGSPRRVSMPFSFKAPSKPGTYRLRCPMVLAFSPVKNYYGSKPSGQNDPGVGPYTEITFVVSELRRGVQTKESEGPTDAARKFITAIYAKRVDEMLKVVSEDVWVYHGRRYPALRKGRAAFKEYASSFGVKEPVRIMSVTEEKRFDGGTICLVAAVTKSEDKDESRMALWFKKVNGHWLLFTPSLALSGYSDADVQAALRAFASTWANRGGSRYTNCRVKRAVPNTFASDRFLWMEIKYDYAITSDNGIRRGTRSSDVWMTRKGNSWKYSMMTY